MPLLRRKRHALAPQLSETERHDAPELENIAPAGTSPRAHALYFSAFAKPLLTANRLFWTCIALFALNVLQGIGAIITARHSGPQPYFIEHDPSSGAVWISDAVSQKYSPDALNKTYFLRIWATRAWTIKPDVRQTLNVDIPAAYAWTIGSAKKELSEYFAKTDRVADRVANTPGLTREVIENSTSFSADGHTAYMLLTLTERVNGAVTSTQRKMLTANLLLIPEKLTDSQLRADPIGLRITDWTLTPYYGPGGTSQ